MSSKAYLDTKEFDRAMGQYLAWTNKDAAQVCNDKSRDWLWRSIRHIPKARRETIKRTIENPRFITWYLNKKYGRGAWDRGQGMGPGQIDESSDWAEAVKALKRRLASVGYLQSSFVKGKNKFMDSGEFRAGKAPSSNRRDRHRQTKAVVLQAHPKMIRTQFDLSSGATNGIDEKQKQAIQQRALNQGKETVRRDMIKYIDRKNRENSRKISVK